MVSSDYQMTFGYGRTDPPYGTAAFPYHRGDDWYMPEGTPIVVNGVQIGVSGHTGFVTGPHCHIGEFVSGADVNPHSQGWTLDNPHVTDIGYDDTNGNYVGLLDAEGHRWVYLHMQEKSTNVKVGDYLDKLPKYNQGDDMSKQSLNDAEARRLLSLSTLLAQPGTLPDRQPTKEEVENLIGRDLIDACDQLMSYTPWGQNWNKVKHYDADVNSSAAVKPYSGPQLFTKG